MPPPAAVPLFGVPATGPPAVIVAGEGEDAPAPEAAAELVVALGAEIAPGRDQDMLVSSSGLIRFYNLTGKGINQELTCCSHETSPNLFDYTRGVDMTTFETS